MKDFVFDDNLIKTINHYNLDSVDDSLQIILKHIDKKITSDQNNLISIKKNTIKSLFYMNKNIPDKWKVKSDYRNMIYDAIKQDNIFNEYLFDKSGTISSKMDNDYPRKKENSYIDTKIINSKIFDGVPITSDSNNKEVFLQQINSDKDPLVVKSFRDEDLNKHIELIIQKDEGKQSVSIAKRYSKKIILQKRYSSVLKGMKIKNLSSYNSKEREEKIVNQSKDPLLVRDTLIKFTKKNRNSRKNSVIFPNINTNSYIEKVDSEHKSKKINDISEFPNRVLDLSKNYYNKVYGPFLNSTNNTRKYNIKNNRLKILLKDVDYNGPYYSHCRTCLIRNMDYYLNLDENQAINILQLIKGYNKINTTEIIKKIKND